MTLLKNNLGSTRTALITAPEDQTICCVHGLKRTRWWLGMEAINHTIIEVPSVVLADNLFMNDVNCFDQQCPAHETAKKALGVPISVLGFLFDASV